MANSNDIPNKEKDGILTIADAVELATSTHVGFARRILFQKIVRPDCFADYAAGEMRMHLDNCYRLGEKWATAQEAFCMALTRPQSPVWCEGAMRVIDMLMQATDGLRQLDPRFGVISYDVLRSNPELIYIGLVQLLVEHPAKQQITKHHRHYLPLERVDSRGAKAA